MPLGTPSPPIYTGRRGPVPSTVHPIDAPPQSGLGREGNLGNMPSTGPAIYSNNPYAPQNPRNAAYTLTPAQQLGGIYNPQLGALNQGNAANNSYLASLGLLNQNQYADKVSFANQNAALDKKALGINQYQDVTLAGNRANDAFNRAVTDYQTTVAHINGMAGLTDAERAEKLRAAQVGHDDQLAKLQANYGFNVADLNAAATNNQRGALSSATGRGAVGSLGYMQAHASIADQLAGNLKRESSNLDLGTSGANHDLTASNNATDLAYQNNQLQLQQQRDDAAAAKKKAEDDKAASDAYLASVADQYGVRQDQIDTALRAGLSALGYDAASTVAQLANAQTTGNANTAAQAAALTQSAINTGISMPAPNHPVRLPTIVNKPSAVPKAKAPVYHANRS